MAQTWILKILCIRNIRSWRYLKIRVLYSTTVRRRRIHPSRINARRVVRVAWASHQGRKIIITFVDDGFKINKLDLYLLFGEK